MENHGKAEAGNITVLTDFGVSANPPSTVVVLAAYQLGLIRSGAEIRQILSSLQDLSESSPLAQDAYTSLTEALSNLDNADALHEKMMAGDVADDMETYYEVTLNSVVTSAVRAIRTACEVIEAVSPPPEQ